MTYVTLDYLILNVICIKPSCTTLLLKIKIEVKDKGLFSYLYSDQLQSDGFLWAFTVYVCKKFHVYILSRPLRMNNYFMILIYMVYIFIVSAILRLYCLFFFKPLIIIP